MADKDDDDSQPITPSTEETTETTKSEQDEEPVVDIKTDDNDMPDDMDQLDDQQMKQLMAVLESQQERINELAEQIALLSTRIAHSEPGIGVCSVCHGPVVLEEPEDSDAPHTIRCQQCGEVYHQY